MKSETTKNETGLLRIVKFHTPIATKFSVLNISQRHRR